MRVNSIVRSNWPQEFAIIIYIYKEWLAMEGIGKQSFEMLRPVKELLGDEFSYDQIRLVRAKLTKEI
jgi:hypothetical protein